MKMIIFLIYDVYSNDTCHLKKWILIVLVHDSYVISFIFKPIIESLQEG